MPYIDVHDVTEAFVNANIEAFQENPLEMIHRNMEGCTHKEIKQATLTRNVQSKVSHLPDSNFKQMASSPSFKNCLMIVKDITNSRAIYGPDLPDLHWRPTRKKKSKRLVPDYMGTPRVLYERHKYVYLTADVMFGDRIDFFVSLSRGIGLYTS